MELREPQKTNKEGAKTEDMFGCDCPKYIGARTISVACFTTTSKDLRKYYQPSEQNQR